MTFDRARTFEKIDNHSMRKMGIPLLRTMRNQREVGNNLECYKVEIQSFGKIGHRHHTVECGFVSQFHMTGSTQSIHTIHHRKVIPRPTNKMILPVIAQERNRYQVTLQVIAQERNSQMILQVTAQERNSQMTLQMILQVTAQERNRYQERSSQILQVIAQERNSQVTAQVTAQERSKRPRLRRSRQVIQVKCHH